MKDEVQLLRPAQSYMKPRIIKVNWPNAAKWMCTTALYPCIQPVQLPNWTGYGSDPANAYADWLRKNSGDKWTIG